ncbi:MAG TPA: hypothetical protein VJ725_01210 [Thermoanaerobaculia bacterium]|nr:hypothetical protein [Thermoanaerobaculia bacterium]
MFARRSARLAGREEKKPPGDEETDSEEEEDVVEDEGSEYEEEGETDKKKRAREKARKRREQLQSNKVAGRAVDTSTPTFKLGSTSRAVSRVGRSLLESVYSRKNSQIATTTATLESAEDSVTLPDDVPPFALFSALQGAGSISPGVHDIRTSLGTLNRGSDRQRQDSRHPGPKRLNYPQVRGLGAYEEISEAPDRPSERLLESEESARDPSSGDVTFAKRLLRKRGRIRKKREKHPESDLAVQELIGANSLDPDIERLKTRNAGNTIDLLRGDDIHLAASTSGTPLLGRDYHQSISRLSDRPGSPTREEEALRHSFRLARESEDLSGLRSPTPEEIQGHRGFSTPLPTTWSAPPPPLATAPAPSSPVADSSGKSPKRKRRRKRKKKKQRNSSDGSSSES